MIPTYFLTDDGLAVLKNLWELSNYPPDSLINTRETQKNDFFRKTDLSEETFIKIAKFLLQKDPSVTASKKSFAKFTKPLFSAVNELGLQDQACQEFGSCLSFDGVLFNRFFIQSPNQTSTLEPTELAPKETRPDPEITRQEIAEWLELLDYRSQLQQFDSRMSSNYQSKVIVFGIPAEDELIEKWILRRLRERVNHPHEKYSHEVEYVLVKGEQWDVKEFCAEIKKQLPLGFSNQVLPDSSKIIDRLKSLIRTKTVLMRISGLQEDWYKDFFDDFCTHLTATACSTDSKIIIFLTQCSKCNSLGQDYFEILDPMDISKEEVDEWLGDIRDKINSRPNSIPSNVSKWSSVWSKSDRQMRLQDLFITICAAFGNTALRLVDLEPYLTKRG
jgi:hypothetical protein